MTVWALFDSGNGSYFKGANSLNSSGGTNIEIYSIGMDIENKNNHFINLDLADYKRLFGDNTLFDVLDKLPKPDLVIASPPCESWSNASAMENGNACWKRNDVSDSLFAPQVRPSPFTIRANQDYESAYINYQYDRQFLKRVNGELTAFNTIEIIKRYRPQFWVIENPAADRLWPYIEDIIGFRIPYKNLARYNNYDYPLQKRTIFGSNIELNLKNKIIKQDIEWKNFSKSYNERSNIPENWCQKYSKKFTRSLVNMIELYFIYNGHRKFFLGSFNNVDELIERMEDHQWAFSAITHPRFQKYIGKRTTRFDYGAKDCYYLATFSGGE